MPWKVTSVVSQLGKCMGTLSSHITSMRCDMASLKLEYATMAGNLACLLEKSPRNEAIHTPTVNDASPKGPPNASPTPKSQSTPSSPFAITNQSARLSSWIKQSCQMQPHGNIPQQQRSYMHTIFTSMCVRKVLCQAHSRVVIALGLTSA